MEKGGIEKTHSPLQKEETIYLVHEQGGRPYQEDRYSYDELFPGVIWAAVYDGHGGSHVSEMARTVVPAVFREFLEPCVTGDRGRVGSVTFDSAEIIRVLSLAVLQADRRIFQKLLAPDESEEKRMTILMRTMSLVAAGSTMSGYLKMPDGSLFIVNLGDSCTAIVTKGKGLLYLTPAHDPSFYNEKLRINQAGGWVDEGGLYSCAYGAPARVKGVLAVSRSFGDWVLEKPSILFGDDAVKNWEFSVYPEDQFQPAHPKLRPPVQAQNWVISKQPDIYHISPSAISEAFSDEAAPELLMLVCSDGLTDIHPAARWGHILSHERPPNDSVITARDEWNVEYFCELLDKSTKHDNVTAMLIKLSAAGN